MRYAACCTSRYFSERGPGGETETLFVSLWGDKFIFLLFCAEGGGFCFLGFGRRLAALMK
jgi:hypothetical protein